MSVMCRCNISKSNKDHQGQSADFGQDTYAQPARKEGFFVRLIQFGFRLLYNELAFTYDPVSWSVSLGHWRDWQRSAIPYLQGSRILELAHGPGHMLLELEQTGLHVIGLDLSPYMGRLARHRIERNDSKVTVIQGEAQTLPFTDRSFSSVLVTFPSDFILEPETLQGVWRVLPAGGRFVIVAGAQLTGQGVLESLIKWLYIVTGQQPGASAGNGLAGVWNLARDRLMSAGFDPSLEQVSIKGTRVTLLIGQRME